MGDDPQVHFEHPADAPAGGRIALSPSPDEADVWIMRQPPRRWPERIAVVTLDPPAAAWIAAPPDHRVSPEALAADPGAALAEARARRIALRPCGADRVDGWIAAVQRLVDAELAAWSDDPGLRRLGRTAVTGAEADRWVAGADGAFVAPVHGGAGEGVAVFGVRTDGAGWLDRHGGTLRAACAAWTRLGVAHRLAARQRDVDTVHAMLGVVEHDLRGAKFGLDLGVRLLRRSGADAIADNVASSVGGPLQDVARLLVGVRRWIDRPAPGPRATVGLTEVWARAVADVRAAQPEREIALDLGAPPAVSVHVDGGALTAVVAAVLDNAVRYGADSVRVAWTEAPDRVVLSVRNRGRLPFEDVEAIVPFRFRTAGSAGVGLCVARHAASAAGVGLTVRQDGPDVAAEVTAPR